MSRLRALRLAISGRHAAVCFGVVILAGAAGDATAVRVVDLRVGIHADHTRIVIELDAPGGHRTLRATPDDALSVQLDARSERRRVVSKGPLVEDVTLTPGASGAVARIGLREPGLDYSEMILDRPPRIVIDVRRGVVAKSGAARSSAEAVAAPAALPPALEPEEPGPAPTRDPFEAPAGYRGLVAAQQEDRAEERLPPPPAPAAQVAAPDAGAAKRPYSTPPPAASPPPEIDAMTDALRSRLAGLEIAPALFVLVALCAGWIVYRGLAARRVRQLALQDADDDLRIFGDGAAAHVPADEAAAHVPTDEAAVIGEPVARADRVAALEPPLPSLSSLVREPVFEPSPDAHPAFVPESELEPAFGPEIVAPPRSVPATEPAGWQALSIPAEPALAADALDATEEVSEDPVVVLEQRILRLESRIEDLVEARERLERFAAAQNEELRVQRAAIARTQRVLRGLVRPDDPAAEAMAPPIPPAV